MYVISYVYYTTFGRRYEGGILALDLRIRGSPCPTWVLEVLVTVYNVGYIQLIKAYIYTNSLVQQQGGGYKNE